MYVCTCGIYKRICVQVDPQGYPNVTHILVDPSCSGSGIVRRIDHPQHLTRVSRWTHVTKNTVVSIRICQDGPSFICGTMWYSLCSVMPLLH